MRLFFVSICMVISGCASPLDTPTRPIFQAPAIVRKADTTTGNALKEFLCVNAGGQIVGNGEIATLPKIDDHRKAHIPPRPIPPPAPPPTRIAKKDSECLMNEQ